MKRKIAKLIARLVRDRQSAFFCRLIRKLDQETYLDWIGVKHGKECRMLGVKFGTEPYLISLGNHVSLGAGVEFITHDGGVWVLRRLLKNERLDYFGPIKIGSNVFIGNEVMILPGVSIGDNVVVGAKSLVTKDIPSNSVWGGVPARHIKSVDEYCQKLSRSVETKGLSYEEKKRFLEKVVLKENEIGECSVLPRMVAARYARSSRIGEG